jgi:hypothetical protein
MFASLMRSEVQVPKYQLWLPSMQSLIICGLPAQGLEMYAPKALKSSNLGRKGHLNIKQPAQIELELAGAGSAGRGRYR